MRVVVIYKRATDYGREVEEWIHELRARDTSNIVQEVNPETRDGESMAQAYEIMQYPTIMALDDQGRVLSSWTGLPLPRLDEVSYYLTA